MLSKNYIPLSHKSLWISTLKPSTIFMWTAQTAWQVLWKRDLVYSQFRSQTQKTFQTQLSWCESVQQVQQGWNGWFGSFWSNWDFSVLCNRNTNIPTPRQQHWGEFLNRPRPSLGLNPWTTDPSGEKWGGEKKQRGERAEKLHGRLIQWVWSWKYNFSWV